MTKIPDKWFGEDIKGSLDKLLREPSSQVTNPRNNVIVPNLDGSIYVPSINLYVAKERTHLGESWNKCHKELQKEGLEMLNPYQFFEFLKYLRETPTIPDSNRILDKILDTRNEYRGEWLNAKFTKNKKEWYVYNHISLSGKDTEKLELCLRKDTYVDLDSINKQGLPTRKSATQNYQQGQNIYFYHPRENCVAWFFANSDRARLLCDGDPGNANPGLGVRGARLKK